MFMVKMLSLKCYKFDLVRIGLMEVNLELHKQGDDEEYVLLDLDSVSKEIDIPSSTPYVLSGLDTLNPVMIIGNKWKLIGHYEQTIGTCLVFTEEEASPVVHEETGPSEANLFTGRCIIDPSQTSTEVKPMTCLHKILKFKLASDPIILNATPESK